MSRSISIQGAARLSLALLLLVTSLGMVCLLVVPSIAVAGDARAGECGTAGDTEMVSCPHLAAERDSQTGKSPTSYDDVVPAVAQVQSAPVVDACAQCAEAAAPQRPVSYSALLRI